MLEFVGKLVVIQVNDVTVDYSIQGKVLSAAMDSLNQMTQAAMQQLDKSMEVYTWYSMEHGVCCQMTDKLKRT